MKQHQGVFITCVAEFSVGKKKLKSLSWRGIHVNKVKLSTDYINREALSHAFPLATEI